MLFSHVLHKICKIGQQKLGPTLYNQSIGSAPGDEVFMVGGLHRPEVVEKDLLSGIIAYSPSGN